MTRRLVIALMLLALVAPTFAQEASTEAPSRERLERILERPQYQHWKLRQPKADYPSDAEFDLMRSLFESYSYIFEKIGKFLLKVKDWWDDLFPDMPKPDVNVPDISAVDALSLINIVGWLAFGLMLVILTITLYRHIRRTGLMYRGGKVLSREQVRDALESGEALLMDGDEWLREADRLLAEKEFRAVYRALYLALLSGLHSAGKIDFRKSRTNWSYVSRFRGADSDRDVFSNLTGVFDETWYGRKSYDKSALAGLRGKVASLLGAGTGAADA